MTDQPDPGVLTGTWQQLPGVLADWSDQNGWAQPTRYLSIRTADIDGDGQAELCGRAAGGVVAYRYSPAASQWMPPGPPWTDEAGWSENNGQIWTADVNGDGCAELLGYNPASKDLEDWRYSAQQWQKLPSAPGWSGLDLGAGSLLLGDVNGDGCAEVIMPGSPGTVWSFDSTTKQWTTLPHRPTRARPASGCWPTCKEPAPVNSGTCPANRSHSGRTATTPGPRCRR